MKKIVFDFLKKIRNYLVANPIISNPVQSITTSIRVSVWKKKKKKEGNRRANCHSFRFIKFRARNSQKNCPTRALPSMFQRATWRK